jgi:thymidylate kinase
VPTPFPLNRLKRAYRWIDGHALPGPDLSLVLDAPGEVMYRRKGEYTPEMLEDWRQHFLSLRDRFHAVEIVDTTRPEEQVRSDVVERIWRHYVDRWKTN